MSNLSLSLSVAQKGTGANMLKAGIKRRRTTRQIDDEKAEAIIRQREIDEKLAKIDKIQEQLKAAQEEAAQHKAATEILTQMHQRGEVQMDENGNVQVIPQVIDGSQMSQSSQQPAMDLNNGEGSSFNIWRPS